MSYKIEIVERNDLIVQWEPSKSSIIGLFSDLLNETKVSVFNVSDYCKSFVKKIRTRWRN